MKSARVMKKAVAYLIPFIEQEKLDNPELATVKDTNGTIVMATVKGDVHDIGKNIVGVVLQCNNYEVIDLGVMVPAQKILDTAREIGADLIGLSGLITPVARRDGQPGRRDAAPGVHHPAADRRRDHLARPHRGQDRRQVRRPRGLGQGRLPVGAGHRRRCSATTAAPKLLDDVKADYDSLRARHAAKNDRPMVTLEQARERATPVDWSSYRPPRPHLLLQQDHAVSPIVGIRGETQHVRVFKNYDLGDLRRYIDWQPFFNAWEMKGSFPDILNNPATGRGRAQALRRRPGDARPDHRRAVADRQRRGRAVPGQQRRRRHRGLPRRDAATSRCTVLHQLRQQGQHREGVPNRSLADFVAPKATGLKDHVGAFAVTAGLGRRRPGRRRSARSVDDYSAILLESLADRLAEAFAERLHERVRTRAVGLRPRRAARQRGPDQGAVRRHPAGARATPPAPTTPRSRPSGSSSTSRRTPGIELTESMAMWPGASVSGFYFSHPESQYFVVGRIGRDQVADYAERKGWTLAEAERWLSPNLGYDPDD